MSNVKKNVGIYSLLRFDATFNEKIALVIIMIYGDILKTLRTEECISQEFLANLIDVDKSLYSRYEKEIQLIPIKHLVTLCNYFNVSLDYIFGLTNIKNYSNVDNSFAYNNLKLFRKEKKLTQNKLATILNTTHSVISDYERGRYLIATPFLYMICKKYNVSADYLLGRIDKPKYLK